METGRVLVVAVDGATWRVIDPMLERGELPALAALRARGCHGTMTSLDSSASAVIWTSVATGVSPEVHGILDFAYEENGRKRLYLNDKLEAPPLWEILSTAGTSVGVTHWWITYPVVPVNGYLISDHAIPSVSAGIAFGFATESEIPERVVDRLVHPASLWETLLPVMAGRLPRGPADPRLFAALDDAFARDGEIADLSMRAAEAFEPRLRMVYFKGIDLVSHIFWGFFRPEEADLEPSLEQARAIATYETTIPSKYRHTDALLAELLEGLRPEDVVVVLSDHGFGGSRGALDGVDRDQYEQGFHRGTHGPWSRPPSRDGIFVVAGGPVTPTDCPRRISLYDVAPTVLYLLGQPIPSYIEGRPLLELVSDEFEERNPVATVEAEPRREVRGQPTVELEEAEQRQIEELRALGYFE